MLWLRGAITKLIIRVQGRRKQFGSGGPMASAGVWGGAPQRGPGAEPLVRGSGGRSPPEAESFLRATAYMLSAHMLSQFRPSVRLSVCHTGGSVKNG